MQSKRRNAIRRDKKETFVEIKDFAHFAAGDFADAGKVEGLKEHRKGLKGAWRENGSAEFPDGRRAAS